MAERLTELEWEVLNATSDDAENLEQIHRLVCFDFVADADDPRGGAWRERHPSPSLAEVADAVRSLVERQLLSLRHDPADPVTANDLSYIWRSWFEPTAEGRAQWAAQEKHVQTT